MSTYLLRKAPVGEDAVTGQLADFLRAFPEPDVLASVFAAASFFDSGERLEFGAFDEVVVEAWPAWTCGEPDLVLSLRLHDEVVRVLIVEAKLGAAKSGADAVDAVTDETVDQLAKYYRERIRQSADLPVTVVYLTHHNVTPVADLSSSLDAIRRLGEMRSATALAWCSWHDVEAALRGLVDARSDHVLRVLASGLADVLRLVGMHHFTGRWAPTRPALAPFLRPLWWNDWARAEQRTRYSWRPADVPAPRPPPARRYRWTRPRGLGPPASFYRRVS